MATPNADGGFNPRRMARRAARRCGKSIDDFVDKFTWRIVSNPCSITWLSLGSMLLTTIVLMASGQGQNSKASSYDWYIASDPSVRNMDKLTDAIDRVDAVSSGNSTERRSADYALQFVYKLKGCKMSDSNPEEMFTPARVQAICQTEAVLYNAADFPDYCYADEDGGCATPFSITTLFYGDHNYTCNLLNQSTVTAGAEFLFAKVETTAGQIEYGFFVDSDAPDDGDTCWTRSLFQFGTPLAGHTSVSSVGDGQYTKLQDWLGTVEEDLWDHFGMKEGFLRSVYRDSATAEGLDVMWFGFIINDPEMLRMVTSDMQMAVFSIIFVWCFIMFHTKSAFVGSLGMLQIVLSLTCSLFVYRIIFQIAYFDTLQSLALFVILGVGADDIFVMMDAWKQSKTEIPRQRPKAQGLPYGAQGPPRAPADCLPWLTKICDPERCCTGSERCCVGLSKLEVNERAALIDWLHRRLVYAYSRAMKAVLNTSFTTAMAFFATAVSPIMPISTFGIYAALCIIANYVFVLTLTPATIIAQELYLRPLTQIRCDAQIAATDITEGASEVALVAAPSEADLRETPSKVVDKPNGMVKAPSRAVPFNASTVEQGESGQDCQRTYPKNWYLELLKVKVGGVKVVAVSFVAILGSYAIFSAYNAAQLSPPTEVEQWFPADHMFERAQLSFEKFLGQEDDDYAELYIVYGMRGLDRSNYDMYKPGKNRGTALFDSSFDLYPAEAQDNFLAACDALRTYECEYPGCQYGLLVRPNSTECFLEEFQSWHKHKYNGTTTYQVNTTTFYSRLQYFRDTQSPASSDSGETWEKAIGFIDGELKYATISARMTLRLLQTVAIKRPIFKVCENFIKSLPTSDTLARPFQYTWDWVWYATEEGLLFGLMLGMAIAFPVALLTLSMATQNMIIALYAIISIGCVVACVLGACRAYLDWDLGIAESVAGVIVIGLAVDYTIHMGHMYDHARFEVGEQRREGRVEFSLATMGFTVFAGAITTAGSGMFLLPTQLLFFGKMAFLIILTIFFSVVYSFGFFMSLCFLIGPEEEQGTITSIVTALSPRGYEFVSLPPITPKVPDGPLEVEVTETGQGTREL